MSRMNINELLRNGPPISRVAEMLDVSRPTFYRQIEFYKNSRDEKMNKHVKEYFDKIVTGVFKTSEEALEYLEQSKFLIAAENESHKMEVEKAIRELHDDSMRLRYSRETMSAADRVAKEEKLDERRKEVEALAESYGIDFYESWFFDHDNAPTVWNEGEIRTASMGFIDKVCVLVDTPYENIGNIEVEIFVSISGQDFSIRKLRIPPNCRLVDVGDLPESNESKYAVHWKDGDKIKTVGPFDLGKTEY